MIKFQTRSARGAVLLDKEYPGWWQRVNPDNLNMWSDHRCVLGQLFGSYNIGCKNLRLVNFRAKDRFGFMPPLLFGSLRLRSAWRKLIQERREATT